METFEEGEPMLDVLRTPEEDTDQLKKRLAEIGVDALLKMVCSLLVGGVLLYHHCEFFEDMEFTFYHIRSPFFYPAHL